MPWYLCQGPDPIVGTRHESCPRTINHPEPVHRPIILSLSKDDWAQQASHFDRLSVTTFYK